MLATWQKIYVITYVILPPSLFILDGKIYEQCDVVAMGFPLGPTSADLFMCRLESIWLEVISSQLFIDGFWWYILTILTKGPLRKI